MSIFKEFENRFKEAIEKVPNVSIDRIHDQTTKYKGSTNVSDFIAYKYPHQYYFECKTTKEGTLNFDNISQWQDLLEKSRIDGVVAGVVIWFYEKDTTIYVDIRLLECMKQAGYKSVPYDCRWVIDKEVEGWSGYWTSLIGEKKRIYFDYDMVSFFEHLELIYGGK